MDIQKLKKEYPEVYSAVVAEVTASCKAQFVAEGEQIGMAKGIAAETQRIKDVRAQALPGHEELVEELMFDGKTTGPEAAVRILGAERARMNKFAQALADDAKDLSGVQQPATGGASPAPDTVDPKLPLEKRVDLTWDKDPDIRAEFGTREAYLAFMQAEESGRARIYKAKKEE